MDPDSLSMLLLPALLLLAKLVFTLGVAAITELPDPLLTRHTHTHPAYRRIQRLTRHPSGFLLGCEVFQVVATLLFGFALLRLPALRLSSALGLAFFYAQILDFILPALLATLLALPFSRLLPRRLAVQYSQPLAKLLYPYVTVCLWLVWPITILSGLLAAGLLRLFGLKPGHSPEQVTEEEIRMLVDAGEETGIIEQSEKQMINNIFEFDERTAGEVMTHRMDLVGVELGAGLPEILAAAAQGYSRLPVYRETIDSIVGVLYVKDLLPLIGSGTQQFSTAGHMRQPLFVPESTRCKELFGIFGARKLQFAVVVDEYGGTSGIVTMEDLLESIVGNMQDEYDTEEATSSRLSERMFTLDGALSLDEVEQLLDIDLPEDAEYDTIGGLVVGALDRIPQTGEHPSVEISGVHFTVLESDERRIIKVAAELQTGSQ